MISTKQLDNGITLNVEEIKGAKTISCFFAFKVGSLYENETNFGICHLLEHILFCGTKNRSSEQIKEDFNNCGTIFNGSTGVYHTRFYIKNIVDFFEKSFEIMADMISNPSFNKNEFIKEKKVVFEEMLRYKDIPNEELVIPTQIESKERANAKYNASFFSITLELLRSEEIGFLIIWIVIPKDFRNILWLLYSFFSLVFIASYIIKNPMKIRRITLIIFITLAGRIEIRKYPNATEKPTKSNETKNKINFAGVDNDVFLSPYVIPIPNESILTDKASKIIVSSIISPLYIICKLKNKVKSANKKFVWAYKLINYTKERFICGILKILKK